jgi:hypothetical protein
MHVNAANAMTVQRTRMKKRSSDKNGKQNGSQALIVS